MANPNASRSAKTPNHTSKKELAAVAAIGAFFIGGFALRGHTSQSAMARTDAFEASLNDAAQADGFEGLELDDRASDSVRWHHVKLDIGECVLKSRVTAGPDDDPAEDFTYIVDLADGVISYEFNDSEQLTALTHGEEPCSFLLRNSIDGADAAD